MNANDAADQWREILRECIVYGMLFKAVARDASTLDPIELKMSYRPILDGISVWAERKHHDFRQGYRQQNADFVR